MVLRGTVRPAFTPVLARRFACAFTRRLRLRATKTALGRERRNLTSRALRARMLTERLTSSIRLLLLPRLTR